MGPSARRTERERRVVSVVAVALAVLLVAEAAVRLRASELPEPQLWSSPEMQLKEAQIDELSAAGGASVVFLGSSTMDVALDASLIQLPDGAKPAYNASTGAGSIGIIDLWARLVAIPRLAPDVVVVGLQSRELNPHDPEQARLEREFRRSPSLKRILGTESSLERLEREVEELSALFRYRTVLRSPRRVRGDADTTTFGAIISDDGQYEGFLGGRYVYTERAARLFQNRSLNRFEIGEGKRATLRRLLTYLRERGIEVLLVSMPITADYVRLHPRGRVDYDAAQQVLADEAKATGARFLDVGVWPDELFADAAHTNAAGTERFSRLLSDELRSTLAG